MSSLFMTYGLLDWIVGPCERFSIPLTELKHSQKTQSSSSSSSFSKKKKKEQNIFSGGFNHSQESEGWMSGVKIVECRYLRESGCKASCLHLCKGPTQEFFRDYLGLPLYMKPDFVTRSCEMRFGVEPPPDEEDPDYKESCFLSCKNNFKGDHGQGQGMSAAKRNSKKPHLSLSESNFTNSINQTSSQQ
jgi:hypothetical protein